MYYIKIITVETDAQAATSITLQLHLVEIKCGVKIIQQKTEKYIIRWWRDKWCAVQLSG